MQSVDPGVLPQSSCFSFTPSETALRHYYYLVWCGHYYCNSDYFMKRTHFPYLLLVYVRKGEFHVEYRDRKLTARRGEVVLIDCQEPHYYRASDGLEFLYIHFDGSNAHELCQHIMAQQGILFQGSNTLSIGKLLHEIVERYEHTHGMGLAESSMLIYKLLMTLAQPPRPDPDFQSPIDIAIGHIRSHVGEKISLQDLARLTNLSVYYFSHSFKQQTGYSPTEYIISTRIDTAKVLLKSTSLTIAEIAERVGYESSGSLINLFVQKVGCSPREFRRSPI
jgi:AraC-like DNA-binding protein